MANFVGLEIEPAVAALRAGGLEPIIVDGALVAVMAGELRIAPVKPGDLRVWQQTDKDAGK